MRNRLKMLACLTACLSTMPLAHSAQADNRKWTGRSAVLDQYTDASCFAHLPGEWTLKNGCSSKRSVFLPMSVDAARWYTVSVYGRGFVNPNGSHNSIYCITNSMRLDGTLNSTSGWVGLPNNGGFGGPQVMTMGAVPVWGNDDAVYTYCNMDPLTTVFGFGWN